MRYIIRLNWKMLKKTHNRVQQFLFIFVYFIGLKRKLKFLHVFIFFGFKIFSGSKRKSELVKDGRTAKDAHTFPWDTI